MFYDGIPVSVLYGFFNSLSVLKRKYPEYLFVIAWDGGYERRERESKIAVEKGLIPSAYKENRHKPEEEMPPDVEIIHEQIEPLKEALKLARVFQVRIKGYEADDIINSYAKWNEQNGGHSVIVTSDKDFLQVLTNNIHIFDAMKSIYWTREIFINSYGFEPELWVDVGALMGDRGDNIHSVKGIGEKNAVKYVKEYGKIDNIYENLRKKEKLNKKEILILENEELVRLAYSLKKMDIIPDLPSPKCSPRNPDSLLQWFKQFRFQTLYDKVPRLTR